ncbi:MAG: SPOR domain-containing protein [Bacteroidales bacterium]|jgi:hypothetical protein|nr:SPOR domain-containing protein [Bacteroidales bacterium]
MIAFICFLSMLGWAEEPVTLVNDFRVNSLVDKHIEYNKITPVNGFRINIFSQSGNHSRSGAMAVQAAFSERFPNIKSYVSFKEPYFRVNVGNFRTRLEASAALESLKVSYPQALVVRDVLNVRDLLGISPIITEEETDDE